MTDLWSPAREAARRGVEPLALRMRPRTLDEVAGQRHVLGEPSSKEKTLLRRMIESGAMTSILLHGPPGTGKTTLAQVIAMATSRRFVAENASSVGVKRIREVIQEAKRDLEDSGARTILFLDEIHRFSRSQQDVLLEDVERGILTVIGATTENPMFSVNSALVSRSTVFRLEPLSEEDVTGVIRRAVADDERGYGALDLEVSDDAIALWASMSDGDARKALNALEVAVLSAGEAIERSSDQATKSKNPIDLAAAEQSIQRKAIVYDGTGDEHYDTISAFIKSVRGSDPDAAVYWLALMLEAGEDPRFIARRLAILASEDIGNADPRAISVAESTWQLVERLGMPECRITLSQCTTYLALAPKSNAAYCAIDEALRDVREGRTVPVPTMLRDAHKVESEGSARHGWGYRYSHDSNVRTSIGGVTGQDYLGVDKRYYRPGDVGEEKVLKERLEEVVRSRHEGTEGQRDGGGGGEENGTEARRVSDQTRKMKMRAAIRSESFTECIWCVIVSSVLVGVGLFLLVPVLPWIGVNLNRVAAVATWSALTLTGALCLWGTMNSVRLVSRSPRHRCTRCGYDIRGLKSGRCPECGAQFEARHHET